MLRLVVATLIVCCLISCRKEVSLIIPSVITTELSAIGTSTVTAVGALVELGDSEILSMGFVASTMVNPTTSSEVVAVISISQIGSYTMAITGLRSNTNYYLRAYATNSAGTAYGEELDFKTELAIPTFLEFSELTNISGFNFTQAIGFQGSESLQAIFLANRERDPSSGMDYEKMYRYDLLTSDSVAIFNPITDFITKQIQIIGDQLIVVGSQYISTYPLDLLTIPNVVGHGKRFTRHGSAQSEGEIYIFGGDLNGIESNLISKWDAISSTFTTLAAMPTAKSYAGGEIVDGSLYIFGGQKEFRNTLHDDIIYIYSIADNSLETLHLPEPLFRSFTARVGSLIYVAGHIFDPTGFDNTDIFFGVFDTADNSFTEVEVSLSDDATASIWAMTAIGNDLYIVYGDPVNDLEPISGKQLFSIQKAEIP